MERRRGCARTRARGLALAVVLGACDEGSTRFGDDIDLEWDFRDDDDGQLHTPYAAGARMRVFAFDGDDGLMLESSDPGVLELVPADDDHVAADAVAKGSGIAELRLVDARGETIASTEIEVRTPSRAVLRAAARQFVERDDLAGVAATPAVLADGVAVFDVHLFDGATRLYGHGGLSARGGDGIDVEVLAEFHGEAREWLRVAPLAIGNHEIHLVCAGEELAATVVAAVGDDAIAGVRLHGDGDEDADDGEWIPLAARAYGHDDAPIHGVRFAWELGGAIADEGGELWRYRVDRSRRETLAVRYGEHEVAATIHAAKP